MLEKCPVCGWKPIAGSVCPNCNSDLAPVLRALEDMSCAELEERQRAARTRRLMVALPAAAFAAGLAVMALVRPLPPRAEAPRQASAAAVAAPAPAATAPKPQPVFYTVRRGDSLWSIAQRVYGQAALWPRILEENRGLAASQALRVGERIQLFPMTIAPQGVK